MNRGDASPRKLHGGHFAFMRALAQGLDERASWDRYLRLEGEHTDLRTVRRTVAWIRDEFAAAAKRQQKPGTARLILLDPTRFRAAPALPSLAEFALAQGMEDFSEAEQLEAYEEAYPANAGGQGERAGRPSRRARVIAHQLEALRWLQDLVAQEPRPSDALDAWLHPVLAARLGRAGLATLAMLVERINGIGARWWAQVPGVGARKAARILEWLRANEGALGLHVGAHVDQPRTRLTPALLAAVVPATTALRPYEKFVLPAEFDGRDGRHRAPQSECLLQALDDREAIGAWLASHAAAPAGGPLSATQRSYRREAERLLLWAVLERKKALSSLGDDDVARYRLFITDPPSAWCGPRHHQRWSPMWRPLERGLSPAALRQSFVILRSLFDFLTQQRYLAVNAFAAAPLPAITQRPLGEGRSLTFTQWDRVEALLRTRNGTPVERRLCRAIRWVYATGLRTDEITQATCGNLRPSGREAGQGLPDDGWKLSVTGRGQRIREVPIPAALVDELGDELSRHGFARQVDAPSNLHIPILARFGTADLQPPSWSASGLYQAIKSFLAEAQPHGSGPEGEPLGSASTHWLRHSHGAHALRGREGQAAVPLHMVQNHLGHSSIATTALYLKSAAEPHLDATQEAGVPGALPQGPPGRLRARDRT